MSKISTIAAHYMVIAGEFSVFMGDKDKTDI